MTELKFSEFSLTPEVHRGISDAGFTYCTPIQSKALPLALTGRDVAGQAQTGTGKTAAYLIALYQYLLTHEPLEDRQAGPRALILAPTRELAVQIHSDAALLGAHLPFELGLAFGGTDYEKQRRRLSEGVDVLIGTPGRLIDFFKQGVFGLRRVQVAVLDEADRMFDLGFLRDIRYILRRLPPPQQRLNLLFSATLSYRVLELAYEHMNDPELIRIEPDKLTVDRVRQVIYFPSNEQKLPLLIKLLREMDAKRTMIFVNTRRAAEHLCDSLGRNGIQAAALSGDVPQRKRLSLMRDFQAGELPVLIATDVASRGLHVPDVSHVFNYDLPQDAEDYVHRVGRTARAGASGDAISFGCEDYVVSLPEIEAYIGRKIDVGTFDHDELAEVSVTVAPRPPRRQDRRDGRPGGRDGRSGSRDGRSGGRDGRSGGRDGRSAGRDGRGGRDDRFASRDARGGQRGGASGHEEGGRGGERTDAGAADLQPQTPAEHTTAEHITAEHEPSRAADVAAAGATGAETPRAAEAERPRTTDTPVPERDDAGERRRPRRRGRRRGGSAGRSGGDAPESAGTADAEQPRGPRAGHGTGRMAESSADAEASAPSNGGLEHGADRTSSSTDETERPKRRRRRRGGRRGAREETASAGGEAGDGAAARASAADEQGGQRNMGADDGRDGERGRPRGPRTSDSRGRGRGPRSGDRARRSEPHGTRRSESGGARQPESHGGQRAEPHARRPASRDQAPSEKREPLNGDGHRGGKAAEPQAEGSQPEGLLARIWSVFRR